MILVRILQLTGRVQGVNMRFMIRQQAQQLAIQGYAKNMPDGSVVVCLSGEQRAVSELETWLRTSPGSSSVDNVSQLDSDSAGPFVGFEIL